MTQAAGANWGVSASRSALRPMDMAVEYLRRRGDVMVLRYIVAMAPFSMAMLWIIDVTSAGYRAGLWLPCWALTAALVWRWVGLGWLQRRVQVELRGEALPPLRRRLLAIVLTRLVAFMAITWGGLLILPAYWGFFVGSMAGPMLLEQPGSATEAIRRLMGWIAGAGTWLGRVAAGYSVLTLAGAVAVIAANVMLVSLMPSLLGIDNAEIAVSMRGVSWYMCLAYFVFLAADLFWSVAAVFVLYDLQSRTLGTDLRLRLRQLGEERV